MEEVQQSKSGKDLQLWIESGRNVMVDTIRCHRVAPLFNVGRITQTNPELKDLEIEPGTIPPLCCSFPFMLPILGQGSPLAGRFLPASRHR